MDTFACLIGLMCPSFQAVNMVDYHTNTPNYSPLPAAPPSEQMNTLPDMGRALVV